MRDFLYEGEKKEDLRESRISFLEAQLESFTEDMCGIFQSIPAEDVLELIDAAYKRIK